VIASLFRTGKCFVIPLLVLFSAGALSAQATCTEKDTAELPSPDLYCIDLIAAPDFPQVSGIANLGHVQSPFGVAVTVDGKHRYELKVSVAGLPDPATAPATGPATGEGASRRGTQ